MTDTLILRFRDVEADTVEEHRERIRVAGATWWAWWKKEAEDLSAAPLSALADHVPLEIGLINRQVNSRYVAECQRIAMADDGQRISSPEPNRTPTYYRDDSFPVWFLLSSISQVSDEEWDRRFGGVPEGEHTLFAVPLDEPDQARKSLQEEYGARSVEIPTSSILHISDLHFGSDFGFPFQSHKG